MNERDEIIRVLEEAYIEGVHRQVELSLMKKGFHPGMNMLVFENDDITKVDVETWNKAEIEAKNSNPDHLKIQTDYEIDIVDVTNEAAMVKARIFKDHKLTWTDYFLLYKFNEGWKIVSKIFASH